MVNSKSENYKLQLTLPTEMHEKLKALAKKKGIAVTALIRIAASELLEREEESK